MQRIHIDVQSGYDVIIGSGILSNAGTILKDIGITGKLCIVSDSNVAPLYLDRLVSALQESGFNVSSFV